MFSSGLDVPMPDSKRSSRGFQQIPESKMATIANPNDATIDIPLTGVQSKTGARRTAQSSDSPNEKADFHEHHAAGRRKTGKNDKYKRGRGEDGEEDGLTRMGLIYDKILDFSVVTRYFLYILPLALLLALPIIIGATAAPNATLGGVRIVWIFTWLLIVWVSLWVSKLFAKCLPAIFQFLCGVVSAGTRKYYLVIKALEIYLSLCGWALASLATFIPVMTRNPTQQAQAATFAKYQNSTVAHEKTNALQYQNATAIKNWESIIQKVLAAALVASLILLAEKVLIQLISIGYHRKQFNAKIQDSKHKIHLLSLLYDASRRNFPAYCTEFAEEDYIINDSLELGDSHRRSRNRTGSVTPMRLLQDVGRFGDKLTSAVGNVAKEVTGKQIFNPNAAHSIVVEALEKNKSSEALAKRLWMSFVVEGKEALYREDIVEVLGAEHQDEAEEAFDVLDRDGNGDISLDEMILTVCEFGKERHSIANSLHDVDQAINVLDNLLCSIVFIVMIFIFVAFLNSSPTTTLATAGTAILSLSFVFAATCQEVLGSCIFLFVKHPFDVLDRVDIGDDQLIVKHISLLFTVFKHLDTHKLTQVPNITLNTLWIQNVSRSEAMREQLKLFISFDTTLEDIQLLKNEMHAFVTDKENSRDFQSDIDVEITGVEAMDKLQLKVEIRHKSNWSNETVRAARRSKFMCALVLALRKIPIYAPGGGGAALGSADQPSYSVALSDTEAAAARDAFSKTKDAKRLFPIQKTDTASKPTGAVSSGSETRDSVASSPLRFRQPPPSESTALSTLNSRHPAADTANSPNDLIEPTTPKSIAHSVSETATPPDFDRSVSIEEVRGLLRRQSTRGKRKASGGSGMTYPIPENAPSATQGSRSEYGSYLYTPKSQQTSSSQPKDSTQPTSAPSQHTRQPPQDEPRQPSWPQPPQSVPSVANQQRLAQQPTSTTQPRQAPPISPPTQPYVPSPPPKDTPPATTPTASDLPAPPPISQAVAPPRSNSPIRNPFQIHALRAQAQGVGVPRVQRADSLPGGQTQSTVGNGQTAGGASATGVVGQVRRPTIVGENENAVARGSVPEEEEASVMNRSRPPRAARAPPRSDSLGGRRPG